MAAWRSSFLVLSVLLHAVLVASVRSPARADDLRPFQGPDRWVGEDLSLAADLDISGNPAGGQTVPPSGEPVHPTEEAAPVEPRETEAPTVRAPPPKRRPRPAPAAATSRPSPRKTHSPPPASGEVPGASAPRSGSPGAPQAAPTGSFGSAGVAGVRDLGRAFTRAIPPACQADPAWSKLPLGEAATAEIAILVDGDGKITGSEQVSREPSPQLLSLVRRTLALLRGGTFAMRGGAPTAGRQVLSISFKLRDIEPEQVAGGAIHLEWDYDDAGRGKAWFIQGTRRVDIALRVVRVEGRPAAGP